MSVKLIKIDFWSTAQNDERRWVNKDVEQSKKSKTRYILDSHRNCINSIQSMPKGEASLRSSLSYAEWIHKNWVKYHFERAMGGKMHRISTKSQSSSSHPQSIPLSLQHLFKSRTIVVSHLGNETEVKLLEVRRISKDDRGSSRFSWRMNNERLTAFTWHSAELLCEVLWESHSRLPCSSTHKKAECEFQRWNEKKEDIQSNAEAEAHTFEVLNLLISLIFPPTISLSIKKEHSFSFSKQEKSQRVKSAIVRGVERGEFSVVKKLSPLCFFFSWFFFLCRCRLLSTTHRESENVHKNLL